MKILEELRIELRKRFPKTNIEMACYLGKWIAYFSKGSNGLAIPISTGLLKARLDDEEFCLTLTGLEEEVRIWQRAFTTGTDPHTRASLWNQRSTILRSSNGVRSVGG